MTVKKGDKVKVDYTGMFEDGSIFDSSKHGDHSHPLEFEVGAGHVIKGFDDAVVGMELNGEKEIKILPEEGYGLVREELVQKVPKEHIPDSDKLKAGMMLMAGTQDGHQFPVRVKAVDHTTVTVDMNHPLAGKVLKFKIKLIEVA